MTNQPNLLPDLVAADLRVALPDGFDSWGLKSIHPDRTTSHGYTWPEPGQVATCDPNQIRHRNTDPCPLEVGDGLCVGLTWAGMASGGLNAQHMLLVAYRQADVLGENRNKLRTSHVAVVADLDGTQVIRRHGNRTDLTRANLTGMDVAGVDLSGTDLGFAQLARTNLARANLAGANLAGANLADVNLSCANLAGADLTGANLEFADLSGTNLTGTRLADANLASSYLCRAQMDTADMTGANLTHAILTGANLAGANLAGADLDGATAHHWAGDRFNGADQWTLVDGHLRRTQDLDLA